MRVPSGAGDLVAVTDAQAGYGAPATDGLLVTLNDNNGPTDTQLTVGGSNNSQWRCAASVMNPVLEVIATYVREGLMGR